MKPEYQDWIRAFEERCGGAHATLGRCRQAAEEMIQAFPELSLEKGHVECPLPWGRRGHWWCVAPNGEIVDPTAGQFTCGIFDYDPFKEGDEVVIGKCMQCGETIWGQPGGYEYFCSKDCEDTQVSYLNSLCR